jgi:hypothetical protein
MSHKRTAQDPELQALLDACQRLPVNGRAPALAVIEFLGKLSGAPAVSVLDLPAADNGRVKAPREDRVTRTEAEKILRIGRTKLEALIRAGVFSTQRDSPKGERWLFRDEVDLWLESAGDYAERESRLREFRIRKKRLPVTAKDRS